MKIGYPALLFLNAAAGMICIVMAELIHSVELALVLLPFPLFFLIIGYVIEWTNIRILKQEAYTPAKEFQDLYRMAQFALFIVNIIALFIIWLRPFPLTNDSGFWEMIFGISVYGGFPLLILYLDFSKPGKELARRRLEDASA